MRNKAAFDEVIGDPFSKPDGKEGHYSVLKGRSSIIVAGGEQKSPSPVNRARPTAVDFFCDVDKAIEDGMSTLNPVAFQIFVDTYLTEDPNAVKFTQQERAKVEQIIGNILVDRKIYPVAKYFTTIRK